MTDRPIIMTAESVRGILAGRKTMTRRIVRGREGCRIDIARCGTPVYVTGAPDDGGEPIPCPFAVGQRLWVKEAWAPQPGREESVDLPEHDGGRNPDAVCYRADERRAGEDPEWPEGINLAVRRWRSPLYMPRWASRLSLEVVSVRCERLHDITDDDARAEGVTEVTFIPDDGFPPSLGYMAGPDDGRAALFTSPRDAFEEGWNLINGKRAPWSVNPWVWVVEFRRVEA